VKLVCLSSAEFNDGRHDVDWEQLRQLKDENGQWRREWDQGKPLNG